MVPIGLWAVLALEGVVFAVRLPFANGIFFSTRFATNSWFLDSDFMGVANSSSLLGANEAVRALVLGWTSSPSVAAFRFLVVTEDEVWPTIFLALSFGVQVFETRVKLVMEWLAEGAAWLRLAGRGILKFL